MKLIPVFSLNVEDEDPELDQYEYEFYPSHDQQHDINSAAGGADFVPEFQGCSPPQSLGGLANADLNDSPAPRTAPREFEIPQAAAAVPGEADHGDEYEVSVPVLSHLLDIDSSCGGHVDEQLDEQSAADSASFVSAHEDSYDQGQSAAFLVPEDLVTGYTRAQALPSPLEKSFTESAGLEGGGPPSFVDVADDCEDMQAQEAQLTCPSVSHGLREVDDACDEPQEPWQRAGGAVPPELWHRAVGALDGVPSARQRRVLARMIRTALDSGATLESIDGLFVSLNEVT